MEASTAVIIILGLILVAVLGSFLLIDYLRTHEW